MKWPHVTFLSCLLALSACGGNVKETLGLNHRAPDEFRVVSRPPLSMPPEFALRPPASGSEAPAAMAAHKQVEALLLGRQEADGNRFSLQSNADAQVAPVTGKPLDKSAEAQFLKAAGADDADPNIRTVLSQDRTIGIPTEEETSWWESLTLLPPKKDTLVDAKKESARIKKNEEEGKPATDGDTAVVKQRDTGILGNILGY